MTPLFLLAAIVSLDLDDCSGAAATEIERIARIELDTRLVNTTTTATTLSIRCEGAMASLSSRRPGRTDLRALDLSATSPAARARLLAIALVELLEGPPPGDAIVPPAPPPPPPPPVEVVTPRPAPKARRPLRLAVGLGITLHPSPSSAAFSAKLAADYHVGEVLGVGADLAGDFARRSVDLGAVQSLAASASVVLSARRAFGGAELEAAAGARVGYAHLSGSAGRGATATSGSVDGPWGGPLLRAGGWLALGDTVVAGLDAEIGATVRGVVGRADGAPALGPDGLWVRVGLLVALTP